MIAKEERDALNRLSTLADFQKLSVTALLFEAIRSSSVRETDTIFKTMKAEMEADNSSDHFRAMLKRIGIAQHEPS
jgi:hypothetical protein